MTDKLSCCGIDVSHLTLDVTYQNNLGELFYLQVGNNNAGFKKLLEHTGQNCHFVMEATGVYYIRLAFFLDSLGCKLSVVNAMSIKRYIQMHLVYNPVILTINPTIVTTLCSKIVRIVSVIISKSCVLKVRILFFSQGFSFEFYSVSGMYHPI